MTRLRCAIYTRKSTEEGLELIAQAHVWFDDLKTGRARSNRELTERHQVDHADCHSHTDRKSE